jgi:hypothetical protein
MRVALPEYNQLGFIDTGDEAGRRTGKGIIHEHPRDTPGVRQ